MQYIDLYAKMKEQFSYDHEGTYLECGLVQYALDFHSRVRFILPEEVLSEDPPIPSGDDRDTGGVQVLVNKPDAEIEENLRFRYSLLMPASMKKARNIIMMFHGFNEKHWHKYLPWAARLSAKTNRAVLLFPIAFHMNRAPALWNDSRAMNRLSKERKDRYPAVIGSSLSNVAISMRLHNKPERFIWSGLESYHDVIDLVESIKRGEHPLIEAEAGIDFCSYSIGTFLGEILMMTNKCGYFSKSRYATFCGGPVFNRLSPVSKFILDSEANVTLYSYLVEHLESHMKTNSALHTLLSGKYEEGVNFRSLLSYRDNLPYREDKLRELSSRFYAVALADDTVVPPYEVINTLRGSKQDIDIRVDVLKFPYPYRHEDPFPVNGKLAAEVDTWFCRTFDKMSGFLNGEKA